MFVCHRVISGHFYACSIESIYISIPFRHTSLYRPSTVIPIYIPAFSTDASSTISQFRSDQPSHRLTARKTTLSATQILHSNTPVTQTAQTSYPSDLLPIRIPHLHSSTLLHYSPHHHACRRQDQSPLRVAQEEALQEEGRRRRGSRQRRRRRTNHCQR